MTDSPVIDGTIVRCYMETPTWHTYEQFVVWANFPNGSTLMQQMLPESSERPHQDLMPSGQLVCGHIVQAKMRLPGGIILKGFVPDGKYKPRDPKGNSLEILTKMALQHFERGEVLSFKHNNEELSWEERVAEAQRNAIAQGSDIDAARANVFREAKNSGMPIKQIAENAGLSRSQMYTVLNNH